MLQSSMSDIECECRVCGAPATHRSPHGGRSIFRCTASDCGLEFLVPQPSPAELNTLYQGVYYQRGSAPNSSKYPNTPRQVSEKLLDALAVELGPIAGRRILDFGSGTGEFAETARSRGADVWCVEPDLEAGRQTSVRGLPWHPNLISLQQGNPDGFFDIVTSVEVAEHLMNPVKDFTDLKGLLVPGGAILITTPNFASLSSRVRNTRWEQYQNPTHLFYFRATSLQRLLRAAGFGTVRRLRTRVVYPGHGPLRRAFQRGLRFLGLDGDLVMLAWRDSSTDPVANK